MSVLDFLWKGRTVALEKDALSQELERTQTALVQSQAAYTQAVAVFREVTAASLYARWQHGRALRRPWSHDRAIREGLSASAWVYICVHTIAAAAASVPMDVYRRRGHDVVPMPSHPLQALLRQPNPAQTWNQACYILTSHHVLAGEGYLGKMRGGYSEPQELWPRSPADLTPVLGRERLVSHYEDRVGGERKPDQPATDIAAWIRPDPANPARGISPLLVGADTVDVDKEGRQWQRSSLNNGVLPSGVITEPAGSPPLSDQAMRLNKQTIEDAHQGAAKARGLLYLDGGRGFQSLAMTNKELDLVEGLRSNLDTLLALFGVPGPVVGLYESATYNNVTTAYAQFWRDTVMPYLNGLAQVLTLSVAAEWGEDIVVRPNVSGVYYLNHLTPETMTVARELRALGAPVSEINRRLNLGLQPWEGWDAPAGAQREASEGR